MTPARPVRQAPRQPGTRAPLGRRVLKLGLAFVTAALLLNALAGAGGLQAVIEARREYARIAGDLDRLRADNAQLRREVTRLRDDASAVEEVARRELGYITPGEKVFIIRDVGPADPKPAPKPGAPASAEPPPAR